MDSSPPGSSVHRIFQARVLEWGAIAFSPQYKIQRKEKKKKELLLKKKKKITITEGPQALPAFQPVTNCTALARE